MRGWEPCVPHLAAGADPAALRMLGRIVPVIASAGIRQIVLTLDEEAEQAAAAWPAALAAEIRPVRRSGASVAAKVQALRAELAPLFSGSNPCAVHLHGLGPCLLGLRALRPMSSRIRLVCSPHPAPEAPWRSALAARLIRKELAAFDSVAVIASFAEAPALSRLLHRSVELLPPVIAAPFFVSTRSEDPRPLVAADGQSARAVKLLTRLSVLLNSREARVRFLWLGPAPRGIPEALRAASVELAPDASEAETAAALSRAWAFIHASAGTDFPASAAQAMATGVPCLLFDTAAHRDLVRHGETGFLCASERDFLDALVLLLRDGAERSKIGGSAREEVERRFTAARLRRAVLRTYGFLQIDSVPGLDGVRGFSVIGNSEGKVWDSTAN